ncbi:MAG: alpha-D-glucose phosphate-specific phosphoglucomutase [Gammaproteobacteria bacterium]
MTNISIRTVKCEPYQDQKPGTAGLRKKVAVFKQPHYLETFVQCIFDSLQLDKGAVLVVGGDGRYYNREAIQTIIAMSAANGIGKLIIGQNGLLSTPAASNLIRKKHTDGGILLTASHNPGGPDGDFGIKFNTETGGQASESMTNEVYRLSQSISEYRIANSDSDSVDISSIGTYNCGDLTVEIIDPVADYVEMMEELFDFELISSMLKSGTKIHFDALNAATGPYAKKIFCDLLGADSVSVVNAVPLEDFGGLHPDPNPVDAAHVVKLAESANSPDLLAASDGDGDRNMILGRNMVVSPGDSLAIMLANASVAPGYRNGVHGAARSMPTSRAMDMVAAELGFDHYETPTGWRFFCNLMESDRISLCGEESFGTSSSHTREKDGLWAVLFWLNMMAALEQPVTEIVHRHWARFGRCFFQRRDYFIEDADKAAELMQQLGDSLEQLAKGQDKVSTASIFNYTDPVDGTESLNQGIRILLRNEGRIVFRLSGTGTSGATLRVYLDLPEYDPERMQLSPVEALAELAELAVEIAKIELFTGLKAPTAII